MSPIILVRHGHAEHIDGDLTGGWTDTDLTDLGRRQAVVLTSRLKEELQGTCVKLYCSDLKRARHTADFIAAALGLKPTPLDGLREINNGIAKDKTKEEAQRYYREPTEPLLDWQFYPEAETWREFNQRVCECMDTIADEDATLLIVTHGGTIVHIIDWWLGLDIATMSKVHFETDLASITVLTINRLGDRTISRLNDTAHLSMGGLHKGRLLNPQ
ncbi:MAG TPA: histidine phosphatase family protein [Candidatus Bathyarchaeia archaeon]